MNKVYSSLREIAQKRRDWIMEGKEKSLFDVITGYSVNEGLGETLRQNEEYIKIQKKIDEQADQIDKQDFTKEQRLMIDRLVCAHTESGAFYGRMTFRKGFQECICLLRELEMLKAS